MKKPEINDLLIGTVTALIVLAISIMVSKAIELLDFMDVMIGAVIFVVIVVGVASVVHIMGRTAYDQEIDALLIRLKEVIPPIGIDWIYSTAEVDDIEADTKHRDIWIISPDLSNDTLGGTATQRSVTENIRKGVTYTYIVPDSEAINALLPALRNLFAPAIDQLKIRKIPETNFNQLTVGHIAIYNPNMEDDNAPQVFLELPIENRGYWVEVDQSAALGLTGRFRKIAESETE